MGFRGVFNRLGLKAFIGPNSSALSPKCRRVRDTEAGGMLDLFTTAGWGGQCSKHSGRSGTLNGMSGMLQQGPQERQALIA